MVTSILTHVDYFLQLKLSTLVANELPIDRCRILPWIK